MQRIVIFGASGLIGRRTATALREAGYEVLSVSRRPVANQLPLDFSSPELRNALSRAYGIINLAGAPIIGKRLTPAYRKLIDDSRIGLTERLVGCLAELPQRPEVLINGSATGYYGTRELTDEIFTETSPAGSGFWADLCVKWETAALGAEALGIRTVAIRTGLVLSKEPGGTLAKLALPFRLGIGGPIGPPESWRSWIHIDDEVGIILYALANADVRGPVNATAPKPLRNAEFAKQLGHALQRPSWLPVPEAAVKLVFGDVGEVITRGKRIVPRRISDSGYGFTYPTFESALNQLV